MPNFVEIGPSNGAFRYRQQRRACVVAVDPRRQSALELDESFVQGVARAGHNYLARYCRFSTAANCLLQTGDVQQLRV